MAVMATADSIGANRPNTGKRIVPSPKPVKNVSNAARPATIATTNVSIRALCQLLVTEQRLFILGRRTPTATGTRDFHARARLPDASPAAVRRGAGRRCTRRRAVQD